MSAYSADINPPTEGTTVIMPTQYVTMDALSIYAHLRVVLEGEMMAEWRHMPVPVLASFLSTVVAADLETARLSMERNNNVQ